MKPQWICRIIGHRWKPGAVIVTECCFTRTNYCTRCLATRVEKRDR